MYGPISGNIPGLSVADSAIVFEFLAKVIQLHGFSICERLMMCHLFHWISSFTDKITHSSTHPVLITFLFIPADFDHKSKRCHDHSKTC
jgi:hypothetical protein